MRLAALALGFILLAAAPVEVGAAEDHPKYEASLKAAYEDLAEKEWWYAYHNFHKAWVALDDRQWTPPPGLLFNLGLSSDKGGGKLLSAMWYGAFLKASPENELSAQVRSRILVLVEEYDAFLLKKVELVENIFREVKLGHEERHRRPRHRRSVDFDEMLEDEHKRIVKAIKQAEAVRIFLGDLKGAKKILREFDIEYETSDSVMGAMVGVGALRAAREYSKDKKNVEEYRKTFESIRSNTAEACGEPINRNYYILAANSYHNKVKKRVFSLESKHSLDNLMDEDRSVTGVVFEPYTRSFFTLGLERLSYDWTVEYCR